MNWGKMEKMRAIENCPKELKMNQKMIKGKEGKKELRLALDERGRSCGDFTRKYRYMK